jgi:2-polyprenyl-3-methyl-5-hydroxy-6-metoxy-1,4-benzoquinol methylase/16S rRNA G966 N2-methylase RsmD
MSFNIIHLDKHINLKNWLMVKNNIYIGPNVNDIPASKWYFDSSLFDNYKETGRKYIQYLIDTGYIFQLDELKGKNVGCYCNENEFCHSTSLLKLIDECNHLIKQLTDVYVKQKPTDMETTAVGVYSITPEKEAETITKIILKYFQPGSELVITDGTAGNGGNTISFSKHFKSVNAIEISFHEADILRKNLINFGIIKKVKIYIDNYLKIWNKFKQNVIFLDPPWGGKAYKKNKVTKLYMYDKGLKIEVSKFIRTLWANKSADMIVLKAPYNFDEDGIYSMTLRDRYIRQLYGYTYITRYRFFRYPNRVCYNIYIIARSKIDIPRNIRLYDETPIVEMNYNNIMNLLRVQPIYWKIAEKNLQQIIPIDVKRKLENSKSEKEFYTSLKTLIPKASKINEVEIDKNRGKKKARDLQAIRLSKPLNIDADTKMLDFGAGNGIVSDEVGMGLGIPLENIYKADIKEWAEQKKRKKSSRYLILEKDKPIPIKDNSFDIILCFQVLHHIHNVGFVLRQFKRILKPGGIIFLREHDLSKVPKIAIDFEHMFYLLQDNDTYDEAKKDYDKLYSSYNTSYQWENLMKGYGFKSIGKMYQRGFNTGYYYQAFQFI